MSTTTAPPAPAPTPTAPAASVDLQRAWTAGMPAGLGMLVVCGVGMAVTFDARFVIAGALSLGWTALGLLPLFAGWSAASRPELEGVETAPPGPTDVATAALAGLVAGGFLAVFVLLLDSVGSSLRTVLINLSPQLLEMLTFGRGTGTGVLVSLMLPTVVAALAGAARVAPARVRDGLVSALFWTLSVSLLIGPLGGILRTLRIDGITASLTTRQGLTLAGALVVAGVAFALRAGAHGRAREMRARQLAAAPTTASRVRLTLVLLAVAVVVPFLFDRSVNDMLINVVIFGIMALGLNIVIGLAGMLDLGYVAFFAVGAYTTAVLTAPVTNNLAISPGLPFWLALPIALAVAVVAGLLIGTPVIRLRGDYLAIVTLGFAAIAQRLVVSDWFAPVLGGPQGVRNVPGVWVGIDTVNATTSPRGFLWLCLAVLGVVIYVAWRLQHSRMGRAWQAIREDETVAEAMGINVAGQKLLAFCVGSVFAALAGALFAAKVSSAFPTSFELLVSVLVLVVVIVGGTGYVPGVLLGSLVLVGVLGGPTTQGLLAEFANFKLLIYGALLVVMMLNKPEGLLPRPERGREIEQEEMDQDAWFDKNVGGSSAVAAQRTGTTGETAEEQP
jgi:branched-chain amino acid transport system permease protein